MTVNDSQVLHHCNETFSDEDGWIVIKCNESMVIGLQLTIMTIKNNDYPIQNNVTIDLCSKTICKKILVVQLTCDCCTRLIESMHDDILHNNNNILYNKNNL